MPYKLIPSLTADQTAVMAKTKKIPSLRRHDLDNIRSFLTILVVIHHTAVVYGGPGGFSFKSKAFPEGSPLLIVLNAVNQSFFMGLYFWISGRMSALSLSRTSPWLFVRKKLLRLGLPTLLYTLAVQPVVNMLAMRSWDMVLIRRSLSDYFETVNGVRGPVWYCATLLVFDIAAAIGRTAQRLWRTNQMRQPTGSSLYEKSSQYGWLIPAFSSFLIRSQCRDPTFLPIISTRIGYVSQYVYAYTLGYLSYWCDVPRMLGPFDVRRLVVNESSENHGATASTHHTGLPLPYAISFSVFAFAVPISAALLKDARVLQTDPQAILSGWNLSTLLYSVWNELSFVTLAPAVMAYFEHWHGGTSSSVIWNARYAYAAFLVHTLVSVAIEITVEKPLLLVLAESPWTDSQVAKVVLPVAMTFGVGITAAWASFKAGRSLVDRVPGMRSIL